VGVRHHDDAGAASDELWQEPGLNFEAYYDESADVPTVYSGAWYDSYTKATCDNFEALAERKDSDHYLLMGPWTHGWNTYPLPSWNKSYSGELEFGEQALRDYQETRLRFFDHYLKGEDTWGDQPTVQYFQMGTGDGSQTRDGRLRHSGEWRSGEEWPLPDTEFTTYYIHEDGRLSTDEPTAEDAATSYEFDPSDPVPTLGATARRISPTSPETRISSSTRSPIATCTTSPAAAASTSARVPIRSAPSRRTVPSRSATTSSSTGRSPSRRTSRSRDRSA